MASEVMEFRISSGGLCFGFKNDVAYGATKSSVQVPHLNEFAIPGLGTVLSQKWDYTMKSLNGKWTAYPLRSDVDGKVMAWFASHESIQDPYEEAKRILKVANSPYEADYGKGFNDEETWKERVLVINRYDWGSYANNYIPQKDFEPWENALCLVDFQHAKSAPRSEWFSSSHGVYMPIDAEYSFARFGLVEDRSAVHSFIWFTTNSQMSELHFPNDDRKVYTPLSEEARYEKFLTDGSALGRNVFDGLDITNKFKDLSGPFKSEIFRKEKFQVLVRKINFEVNEDYFNNRVESYMEELKEANSLDNTSGESNRVSSNQAFKKESFKKMVQVKMNDALKKIGFEPQLEGETLSLLNVKEANSLNGESNAVSSNQAFENESFKVRDKMKKPERKDFQKSVGFEPRLEGASYSLLNEMACSWLYRIAGIAENVKTREQWIEKAFPALELEKITLTSSVISILESEKKEFTVVDDETTQNIVKFLKGNDRHMIWKFVSAEKLTEILFFLFHEIFYSLIWIKITWNPEDTKNELLSPYDFLLRLRQEEEKFMEYLGFAKVLYSTKLLTRIEREIKKMASIPVSEFHISSGGFCFGDDIDVRFAATQDIVEELKFNDIKEHQWKFAMKSLNGKWTTYPLRSDVDGKVMAWFASHESIQDPYEEAKRILMIDQNHRVIKIDYWKHGYKYNKRDFFDKNSEDFEPGFEDWISYYVVDFNFSKTTSKLKDWTSSGNGACLQRKSYSENSLIKKIISPRVFFGLAEDSSIAQSLLWFGGTESAIIDLHFPNDDRRMLSPSDMKENIQKLIELGAYDGYGWMREIPNISEIDWNGPFKTTFFAEEALDLLLEMASTEKVLSFKPYEKPVFVENTEGIIFNNQAVIVPKYLRMKFEPQALKDHSFMLLNELVCSWIYRIMSIAEKSTTGEEFIHLIKEMQPKDEIDYGRRRGLKISRVFNDLFIESTTSSKTNDFSELNKKNMIAFVGESHVIWKWISHENLLKASCTLVKEILKSSFNSAQNMNLEALSPYNIRHVISNAPRNTLIMMATKSLLPLDMWDVVLEKKSNQ